MSNALIKADEINWVIDPSTPRGTYISEDELVSVLGMESSSDTFHFAVMQMCSQFHAETASNNDAKMIKGERRGLRILTDEEIPDHVGQRWNQALRSAINIHKRGKQTFRPEEASEEARVKWERDNAKRDVQAQTIESEMLGCSRVDAIPLK